MFLRNLDYLFFHSNSIIPATELNIHLFESIYVLSLNCQTNESLFLYFILYIGQL